MQWWRTFAPLRLGSGVVGRVRAQSPPRRPHIVTNQSQANEDVWSRQGDHSPRTWAAAATPSSTFSKAAAGRARTGWFASRTAQASPSAPSSGTPSADCCGLVHALPRWWAGPSSPPTPCEPLLPMGEGRVQPLCNLWYLVLKQQPEPRAARSSAGHVDRDDRRVGSLRPFGRAGR